MERNAAATVLERMRLHGIGIPDDAFLIVVEFDDQPLGLVLCHFVTLVVVKRQHPEPGCGSYLQ